MKTGAQMVRRLRPYTVLGGFFLLCLVAFRVFAHAPLESVFPEIIHLTYSTNAAGQVSAIDYSDSTPDLSFTYSRQGQVKTVSTNGTTAATLAYNSLGQLVSEIQGGLTLTNAYNSLLQLESVGVTRDNTNLVSSSYEYDGSSRLKTVSFCSHTVTYSYWPNSSLISNVVFREGSTTRLTTSRTYDNLNRLTSITSVPSASSAVEFRYGYNQANQRTAVTNADSSRWEFQYDSLGQLTNAAKKWADGTLVAGQQFAYIFDDIGNRRLAIRDAREGANTITLLNQITDRNNPGYINIIGEATNTATVTVNYQRADRKDAYFRKELAVNNANGPVWQGVTNIAVLNQGTNADLIATNLGSLYVPPGTETLQYDADGNLTNDGHWSYTWDAENRLVGQETTTSAVSAGVPKQKLDNAYDWRWRRTQKTVSAWSGSAWTNAYQRKFAYSDWNLVAELDGNGALQRSHVWGLDASGTFQGAGGVGGLLATVFHTGANAGTYFPVYNGNHCIVAYVSAATGATVAEYEYGPFHELLRATGPMAREFNLLASTKYYDWETGNYYYGYRYYSPEIARWLSRDPLQERGGLNIYAFCGNDPNNRFDAFGLDNTDCQPLPWISQIYNNAPTTLYINLKPEFKPNTTTFISPNGTCGVFHPPEVPTGRMLVDISPGGNHPFFDAPREIFMKQVIAFPQGALAPLRYIEAYDRNLSDEEREPAFWDATIATALYLSPCMFKCKPVFVAKTTPIPQYYIQEGVRRSVAVREAGLTEVPATIFVEGQAPLTTTLPINQLFSPKAEIPLNIRFLNIQPPIRVPITVEPLGLPGQMPTTPLSNVKLVP